MFVLFLGFFVLYVSDFSVDPAFGFSGSIVSSE